MNDAGVYTTRGDVLIYNNNLFLLTAIGLGLSLSLVLSLGIFIYGVQKQDGRLFFPVLIIWPLDTVIRAFFFFNLNFELGITHLLIRNVNLTLIVVFVANIFIWLYVNSYRIQLKPPCNEKGKI